MKGRNNTSNEVEHGTDYFFDPENECRANKHYNKCSFVGDNWKLTRSKSKREEERKCHCRRSLKFSNKEHFKIKAVFRMA